jgi:hypothetical protein
MAVPRTRCISTRVSADEYATMTRLAGPRSVSSWLHDVVATLIEDPRYFILLAEVMALRTIVVKTHLTLAAGQPLTDERVRQVIAAADQDKGRQATERLARPVFR